MVKRQKPNDVIEHRNQTAQAGRREQPVSLSPLSTDDAIRGLFASPAPAATPRGPKKKDATKAPS